MARVGAPRWGCTRSVLVAAVVLVGLVVGGCGADAGDPAGEARALVATCRALQERHLGRVEDPPTIEEAEAFLAREPGDGASTAVRWFRESCPRDPDRGRAGGR
jgi:hypothetical protein